jgi:energy-coupling factor transporter ATP-binding protein EcfA2
MTRERITKITMQAFRGVRDAFEINLQNGQSLLMYGDNGTGKSSLADAIEWYFTGEIEMLAKEGREHAVRHLGATKDQGTLVAIETSGELGGAITPKSLNQAAIDAVARETFLLRGRTIADFVDKSKGEKWTALQQLLGLGSIDELRADLQKARTELKRGKDDSATKLKQAEAALKARSVDPKKDAILAKLGKLAEACGFDAQDSIDEYLRLDVQSLVAAPSSAASTRRTLVATLAQEMLATDLKPSLGAFEDWNSVLEDADSIDATHVDVLGAAQRWAKAHPDSKTCPVCDKKIAADALGEKIEKTLADLQEHAGRFSGAEKGARDLADTLAGLFQERTRWRNKGRELKLELPAVPADGSIAVKAAIAARKSVDEASVKEWLGTLAKWDDAGKKILLEQKLDEEGPSSKNQAFELMQLLVAAKQWSDALAEATKDGDAYDRADSLFEAFQTEQRKYVQTVLEQISTEVGRLFGRLHPAGKIGSVSVETWADKGIELAIDFYGQRQRPPHGVLSESYMNSVAIVLFLAMARTFNEKLETLVLDDVVNSFDVTHRGRLGELLLEEFQDWQLVVLTHDRYFFEQIRRKVKGWQAYQVLGWSYDRGPALREQKAATDVDAALELLDEGHVGDAARRGRRGLEHLLKELCEGLEVPLPYRRGNDNEFREIGTLLMGLRRLLKDDSKGKQFLAAIDPTLRSLEADAQSVLNAEAHASDSAGPSSMEVRSTLEKVRDFDALWSCPKCSSRVWKEQGVRCRCGATPFPPPVPKP